MEDASVLPYRTGSAELIRWVEERARGRATSGGPAERGAKSVEGTAATATALALAAPDGMLTERGRRLALADEGERRTLLRNAVLDYPPYRELLTEIERRGVRETTSDWVERWWATRGMGNSGSNRREGAATLGRLADWVGLGRYIPGRRGHPTRIEWAEPPTSRAGETSAQAQAPGPAPAQSPPPRAPAATDDAKQRASNRLDVPLEGGGVARFEIPLRLSAAEKRRLLQLLDLLIVED
jgi:hypothetical protein